MKLVILDRDGVINEDSESYIKSADEWHPIPGSLEAIARLSQAGYRVVVVSNQSGVGRNLFSIEALNEIHEKMHRMIQEAGGYIEAVFFSPDIDNESHYRKPNPGMYIDIARRLKVNLQNVPSIGDSLRDIKAALAVNAKPILVCTGNGLNTLKSTDNNPELLVFNDLAAATNFLLEQPTAK